MRFSAINHLFLVVGAVLFGLAPNATAQDADELIGAYENADGGFRNFLQLTPSGKGVMLVKKPNNEWHLVMAFDWSVAGNTLVQRNVLWTDGNKYYKSHDDSTEIKLEKGVLYSFQKGGHWGRWDRTDKDIIGEVSASMRMEFPKPGKE